MQRFADVIAHGRGEAGLRHRAERGLLVERIVEHVLLRQVGKAVDEGVVDIRVHIDALDAAAALAGVEIGPVDDVLDGVLQVHIGPHIGRVLAAKLKSDTREGAGRRALDRLAGRDRAGEADLVDHAGGDQSGCVVVRKRERAEQALRQPCFVHRGLKAIPDQQRLGGVLEQHRIAGHQRGHHGVHRGEIRIIPRRDREHDTDRLARDVAPEALLRLGNDVASALGERDHRARSSKPLSSPPP